MTVNGLGFTDVTFPEAIGGLTRKFYTEIYSYYKSRSDWSAQTTQKNAKSTAGMQLAFEPHVASEIINKWLSTPGIRIIKNKRIDRSIKQEISNQVVRSITLEGGDIVEGKIFIDASYEGDLMASCGISYRLGREAADEFGEALNGIQCELATNCQLPPGISPYKTPNDPSSGLIEGVHNRKIRVDGSSDSEIQAYNYRLCLSWDKSNQIAFYKPAGYAIERYELLLRAFESGAKELPLRNASIPNNKTDTNNHGGFSTDYIGNSKGYAEATYNERKEIENAHRDHVLGLLWTLATSPRVPPEIRRQVNSLGFAKDEFLETGGFPQQLYIREARRLVGVYVTTQSNCEGTRRSRKPIAMASYAMDSHNTQRYIDGAGHVRNEGNIEVQLRAPFGIDYFAVLPKKEECTNLLVPVCLSATHIAYGSIRMEPTFMMLGESCAIAACIAIDSNKPLQDIAWSTLCKELIKSGQIIQSGQPDIEILRSVADILVDESIIDSANYWINNARPGQTCDGAKILSLVTRFNKKQQTRSPGASNDPWITLKTMNIIGDLNTWRRCSEPGYRCKGEDVGTLLLRLAAQTPSTVSR